MRVNIEKPVTLLGRMLQLSPQPGQSDVTILPCFAEKSKGVYLLPSSQSYVLR